MSRLASLSPNFPIRGEYGIQDSRKGFLAKPVGVPVYFGRIWLFVATDCPNSKPLRFGVFTRRSSEKQMYLESKKTLLFELELLRAHAACSFLVFLPTQNAHPLGQLFCAVASEPAVRESLTRRLEDSQFYASATFDLFTSRMLSQENGIPREIPKGIAKVHRDFVGYLPKHAGYVKVFNASHRACGVAAKIVFGVSENVDVANFFDHERVRRVLEVASFTPVAICHEIATATRKVVHPFSQRLQELGGKNDGHASGEIDHQEYLRASDESIVISVQKLLGCDVIAVYRQGNNSDEFIRVASGENKCSPPEKVSLGKGKTVASILSNVDKLFICIDLTSDLDTDHQIDDPLVLLAPNASIAGFQMNDADNSGFLVAWILDSQDAKSKLTIPNICACAEVARRYTSVRPAFLATSAIKKLSDRLNSDSVTPESLPSTAQTVSDAESHDSDVPIDLKDFLAQAGRWLRLAYDATQCGSATLRLLSIDACTLVRILAYPRSEVKSAHQRIAIPESNSVNSFVIRTGREAYIHDVTLPDVVQRACDEHTEYFVSRAGQKSEFCIPIASDDRVIGTLNFESPKIDGLLRHRTFLRIVAALVAMEVRIIRRATEGSVFDFASAVVLSAHTLLKIEDNLNQLKTHDLPKISQEHLINQSVDYINSIKASMNLPSPIRRLDGVEKIVSSSEFLSEFKATLFDVLGDVQFSLNIKHDHNDDTRVSLRSSVSNAVLLSSREVLENARRYLTQSNRSYDSQCIIKIRIEIVMVLLGGRQIQRIVFANLVDRRVPPEEARDLFRRPIRSARKASISGDRPRFGCFLAGAMLRRVGGDVGLIKNGNDEFVCFVDGPCIEQ